MDHYLVLLVIVVLFCSLFSLYKKAALKGKPKEVKYVVAKKSQGKKFFLCPKYERHYFVGKLWLIVFN